MGHRMRYRDQGYEDSYGVPYDKHSKISRPLSPLGHEDALIKDFTHLPGTLLGFLSKDLVSEEGGNLRATKWQIMNAVLLWVHDKFFETCIAIDDRRSRRVSWSTTTAVQLAGDPPINAGWGGTAGDRQW